MLQPDQTCRVLDVACGIGRWADAVSGKVGSYVGIDFSEELIQIAKSRCTRDNVRFYTGSVLDLTRILKEERPFNRVLAIGILMYLNDSDVIDLLGQIGAHCERNSIICIREPIGIEDRLTLKDFYSSELQDNYNAIYRTRDELIQLMEQSLFHRGFSVEKEGFLFDDESLNNRKETAQYFFILKR